MKVTISKSKGKAGIKSLWLEFYHGHKKIPKDKLKHHRELLKFKMVSMALKTDGKLKASFFDYSE